ncbi:MAG TPA: VF530 family protein [Azoarcus taiwanensis]|nr:VF530 family protein [Azoarcus taiwanensis]
MSTPQPNNPLHGLTLERILNDLVTRLGWAELGRRVRIRCFTHEPSISSSLKFLRRTPWAREQVEALYLETVDTDEEGAPASRRKEGARQAGRLAANEP